MCVWVAIDNKVYWVTQELLISYSQRVRLQFIGSRKYNEREIVNRQNYQSFLSSYQLKAGNIQLLCKTA